jgi:zona occludens toxin (predicted ATPase)
MEILKDGKMERWKDRKIFLFILMEKLMFIFKIYD